MLGRLFKTSTLKQDLEKYLKKITSDANPDSHDISTYRFKLFMRDGYFCQDLDVALKLLDDLNGKDVIYTDADFLLCRNTHHTNKIGRMMAKHKDNLPPKYSAQRATVTDAHLDGVLHEKEQEQNYGGSSEYRPT